MIKIIFFIFLTVISLGSIYSTNFSSCQTFSSTDNYTLTADILTTDSCITITADNVVLDCQGYNIDGDDGGSDNGIRLQNVSGVVVKNCNITDFGHAIQFYGEADSNIVANNTIYSNLVGLDFVYWYYSSVFHTPNNNLIYNNLLQNVLNTDFDNYADDQTNIFSIVKTAGTNIVGGSFLGGNYWSNYIGSDGDGDGIGDTSHQDDNVNNVDNNPIRRTGVTSTISSCQVIKREGNYTLTANLSGGSGQCVYVVAPFVNIDCRGYTIDGTDSTYSDGIYFNYGSSNNSVSNCIITDFGEGVTLQDTQNTELVNVNISSCSEGIYFYGNVDNNLIKDSVIRNNNIGLDFNYNYEKSLYKTPNNNLIYNNFFMNNLDTDFDNYADDQTNTFNIAKTAGTNIIGGSFIAGNFWSSYLGSDSDGDGIGDTSYQDDNVNNIDNNPLLQVPIVDTISSCGSINQAGNYTLTGNISNYYSGAYTSCFYVNVPFVNLDCQGHKIDGQDGPYPDGIVLKGGNSSIRNCVISDWDVAINIYNSRNHVIENVTTFSSYKGIFLYGKSDNNVITNSTILRNQVGLDFTYAYLKSLTLSPANNLFYNNYILNSINSDFDNYADDQTNTFNIAKTAGTNIVGGSFIGGNYWSSYTGVDNDDDGIGDTIHQDDNANNIDNLPLIKESVVKTIDSCGVLLDESGNYTVITDLYSSTQACIRVAASNVNIDCQGHTIDGDDSPSLSGIYVGYGSSNNVIKNCVITDWDYGVYLGSSSNNEISNCNFSSNDYCIDLNLNSDNNNITGNMIGNSFWSVYIGYGIEKDVAVYPENNLFFNNYFYNNLEHFYFSGTKANMPTILNVSSYSEINIANGLSIGGNYWDDHVCVDANSDGFCDSSYLLEDTFTDELPLVNYSSPPTPPVVEISGNRQKEFSFISLETCMLSGIIILLNLIFY